MVHVPSFVIGGVFSGTAFLMIHEQVSHRSRLSQKWAVADFAEEKWRELKANARKTRDIESKKIQPGEQLPSFQKEWNKAVGKLQHALRRDE